uniref:Uncharacterized protein n=1 Tax=Parascaris univalens TaxID=6257 RepID=A0A915AFI0_PARUN
MPMKMERWIGRKLGKRSPISGNMQNLMISMLNSIKSPLMAKSLLNNSSNFSRDLSSALFTLSHYDALFLKETKHL